VSTTIREQSDQLKAAAAERLPADVVAVFDRSIEEFLAEGVPAGAVAVGDTLESFTLLDALGAPVTLDELVETGPAVIVFYRGGWCPYCNLALRTYQRELLPELAAFSARLVAISPQTPDQSLSTTEKAELEFTVLSDPASRLARQIGIAFQQADDVLEAQRKLGLDLAQVNAEGSTELPRPTVLIVDGDRTVRFVDVQPDYTARTEVADILAALAGLRPLCGQGGVAATVSQEAAVRSGFDDRAVVEHDDLVGVADGREPVRDCDGRAAVGEAVER
jgi:peroxiredoxin